LVDAARSFSLCEAVLGYAEKQLADGGALVCKFFQGGDSAQLLQKVKKLFGKAATFKPKACRASSFETYIVATGRLPDVGRAVR
jgi:23S rRNA (uridine2552-2'-O)-methyltransferase